VPDKLTFYREQAEACAKIAAEAGEPVVRLQYLELARQWRVLLAHAEKAGHKSVQPEKAAKKR